MLVSSSKHRQIILYDLIGQCVMSCITAFSFKLASLQQVSIVCSKLTVDVVQFIIWNWLGISQVIKGINWELKQFRLNLKRFLLAETSIWITHRMTTEFMFLVEALPLILLVTGIAGWVCKERFWNWTCTRSFCSPIERGVYFSVQFLLLIKQYSTTEGDRFTAT